MGPERSERVAESPRAEIRVPDETVYALIIAALAVLTFLPSVFGPFVFDDTLLIPGNPFVRSLSSYRAWFTHDFWEVGGDPLTLYARMRYYRPLVTASYAFDYSVGGGTALPFHVTNLVAHAAVSVLGFFTLRRWIGPSAHGTLAAAVAGALFAVHPTHAENVAWISGRTDVLCMVGMLVALAGIALRLAGPRRRGAAIAIEIGGTVVAYLTKEGAVVLPVLAAVEAWVALGRPALDRTFFRRAVPLVAPQAVVAALYLLVRSVWLPLRPGGSNTRALDHLLFVPESYGHYVAMTLAPHELSTQRATIRTLDGKLLHAWPMVVVGIVSLVVVVVAVWSLRRRAPGIAIGLATFMLLLAPVGNLVRSNLSQLVSERFLYTPLIAVAFVVGLGVEWSLRRGPRTVPLAASAAVALLFALTGASRAMDFSDDERFWARERVLHPEALPPRRMEIERLGRAGKLREAYAAALSTREVAAKYYRHGGAELELLNELVQIRAQLTPDHDRKTLEAIAGFYAALGEQRTAVLALKDLSFTAPMTGAFVLRARELRPIALATRADIASRLGDDAAAVPLAVEAARACGTCVRVARLAAIVHARAGHYREAHAVLDRLATARGEVHVETLRLAIRRAEQAAQQAVTAEGPMRFILRATELSLLEATGRAYDTLAPYRAEIEQAPGFAVTFAELAYRSGERAVAAEVLARVLPKDRAEAQLAEWAKKTGLGE